MHIYFGAGFIITVLLVGAAITTAYFLTEGFTRTGR